MIRKKYFIFLFLLISVCAFAETRETEVPNDAPVVIVTSYNPDVKSISDNVTAFTKRFTERECTNPVVLESLHALNLSESVRWPRRLRSMLSKYYEGGKKPAVVVLLGNEAVSTFFSIEDEEFKSTPVVVGMRGDNMVKVTEDRSADLIHWSPESYLLSKDFPDYNIVGGLLYKYDVKKTIAIIDRLPRQTDTLAFISDNTFGGVTMLSYFRSEVEKISTYPVKYIDGREYSFSALNYELSRLNSRSAVVIGTWRIDSTDSYALSNTTHTLAYANENVPAVTMASVGLGHWAIGGYSPQYRLQGSELADDVVDYIETGMAKSPSFIPSKYTFDSEKAAFFRFDPKTVTDDYILLNKETSFFRENLGLIIAITAFVLLLIFCLVVAIVFLVKSQRLKRQLEKQIVEIQKANDANDAKTSFLFNMSHDIRTPMNAILGFADLIEQKKHNPELVTDYINKIKSSGQFLLSLINNVLDMARIESGKMEIDEEFYDMLSYDNNTPEIFSELANGKKITLTTTTNIEHRYVMLDKTKVKQIILNLLSNAIKYTPEGGTVNYIFEELPCEREGYATYVSTVSDTGIGMSPEFAKNAFGVFTREHNTTESRQEGAGLGMSIVKHLVEMMGGTIEMKTEQGKGTTIVVTMSHKIVEHPEQFVNGKLQNEEELNLDNLFAKRILLAEDNDLNAEIAMAILCDAGLVVELAEDGLQCVKMLSESEPGYYDLILMDVQMPNMNGYEATRAIRALPDSTKSRIPIVAMTANAFDKDKRDAFAAGMNGHLAKPINVAELMKTLSETLR